MVNKLRGTINVCAVKAPGFCDRRKAMMEDIAVLTGGKCITEDLGIKLESIGLEDLGRAKSIVVDKENTTIVEGYGKSSEIQGRVNQIRRQSKKPRAITTVKNCRNVSRSWRAAWPSSTSARRPNPK